MIQRKTKAARVLFTKDNEKTTCHYVTEADWKKLAALADHEEDNYLFFETGDGSSLEFERVDRSTVAKGEPTPAPLESN